MLRLLSWLLFGLHSIPGYPRRMDSPQGITADAQFGPQRQVGDTAAVGLGSDADVTDEHN